MPGPMRLPSSSVVYDFRVEWSQQPIWSVEIPFELKSIPAFQEAHNMQFMFAVPYTVAGNLMVTMLMTSVTAERYSSSLAD